MRWLAYVAMALVGALLTFVGARAQQRASDEARFRTLIDAYCTAWSSGDTNAPAQFYAKDDGLVFYDITPFSYHGWKEYHDGVQKEFFAIINGAKHDRHGWLTLAHAAKPSEPAPVGVAK